VPAAATAALIAVAAAAGTGSSAFGAPTGSVAPIAVTDVHYSLTPWASLGAVSFELAPAGASLVRASVDGVTWHVCRLTGGRARCELGGAGVADVRALRVVAVS
jgi:hypothetical protein